MKTRPEMKCTHPLQKMRHRIMKRSCSSPKNHNSITPSQWVIIWDYMREEAEKNTASTEGEYTASIEGEHMTKRQVSDMILSSKRRLATAAAM